MTSRELVGHVVKLLDDKKAKDINILEIKDLTSIGDYFVIASGGSSIQVKALAGEVEEKLAEAGVRPKRIEGESSAMWVLMDYYDVIIHIFYHETRDFYCLERLWADAPSLDASEFLK